MTAYHHGHLREALIAGALELIEELGVEGLTIRGLAEHVGVSHAAPQHHFADKAALLVAIATEGFVALVRALEDQASRADPAEAFAAMGRTYVEFAFASPQRYRLMFAADLPELKALDEAFCAASEAAFDHLTRTIARYLREPDTTGTRVMEAAFFAWATVHGAVMLHLDGTFPRAVNIVGVAVATDAMMEGLLRHVALGLRPDSGSDQTETGGTRSADV